MSGGRRRRQTAAARPITTPGCWVGKGLEAAEQPLAEELRKDPHVVEEPFGRPSKCLPYLPHRMIGALEKAGGAEKVEA